MEEVVGGLHSYYFAGALCSVMCTFSVVLTYFLFRELRKHPSSLLFWRSFLDLMFGIQFIIIFAWEDAKLHCGWLGIWFHVCLVGSQLWYFCMVVDLFKSMRNPFQDARVHIPLYHTLVWGVSAISAIILATTHNTAYREAFEVCWISEANTRGANLVTWGLFFIPTLLIYFASIGVIVFASLRLRQGLSETLKVRRAVLMNSLIYTCVFCAYWTGAAIIYFYIFTETNQDPGAMRFFAIVIGCLGVTDAAVWWTQKDVRGAYRRWKRGEVPKDQQDDINTALRREILMFTTQGIDQSVAFSAKMPLSKMKSSLFPESITPEKSRAESVVRILLKSPQSSTYRQEAVPFSSFGPQAFRYLRYKLNISDDDYRASILGQGGTDAIIERFGEGRSGSFFYFTQDGKYIVKQINRGEAKVLIQILDAYIRYMVSNPDSLIVKFLGLHTIEMYNMKVYFVVMESAFKTNLKMHDRYDIKGSWVDRHRTGSKGVLKDNDMHTPLLLSDMMAERVLQQSRDDAEFLCRVGIMDYSMLIGVHQIKRPLFAAKPAGGSQFSSRRPTRTNSAAVKIGTRSTSVSPPPVDQPDQTQIKMDRLTISDAPQQESRSRSSTGAPDVGDDLDVAELDAMIDRSYSDAGTGGHKKSLLIRDDQGMSYFQQVQGGLPAQFIEGPGIYCLAIIDILQTWNLSKKVERFIKTIILQKHPQGISCVEPVFYASRFNDKLKAIVSSPSLARERSAAEEENSFDPASVLWDDDDHQIEIAVGHHRDSTIKFALSPKSVDTGSRPKRLTYQTVEQRLNSFESQSPSHQTSIRSNSAARPNSYTTL